MSKTRFNQKLEPIGVTICEANMSDGLGHYDESTATITIGRDQPRVGKYITLIHEAMHAVDSQMVSVGITKRRVPHNWIESAAMNLFLVLALGGFIKGVTPQQAHEFASKQD